MLSSSERNKLTDAVNTKFADIGKKNGTRMPTSTSNTDSYAYDLWVAQQLVALANKRKEHAEKATIKVGVLLDKQKNPQPEGSKQVIYNGDNVAISLAVSNAAARISIEKLLAYLTEHGVPGGLLDDAVANALSKSRPAHVFSTYLLTND